MYSVKNFQNESSVASVVGRHVAKNLGYRHLNVYVPAGFQEIQMIKLSGGGKEDKYLNLFIVPNGENWKISAIGLAVANNCIADLTEEEKKKLWEFGTAYTYKNLCISMCDASNIDINTMSSYAITNASPDKILVDDSSVSSRKTVSEIIQKWFSTQRAILNGEYDVTDESKKMAETFTTRNQVVEEFAKLCMRAKRCIKYHVSYNGGGSDLKATVSLLSRDNQVYEMFLVVDEIHTGMFYMYNDNGQWKKRLVPDFIGDAEKLFILKGR